MEYLIRNGAVKEECYLQDVNVEERRRVITEYEYGRTPCLATRKRRRKWEWSCIDSHEDIPPKGVITAVWTPDESKARYFQSRKAAQKLIEKWAVLRNAEIVEAGICK